MRYKGNLNLNEFKCIYVDFAQRIQGVVVGIADSVLQTGFPQPWRHIALGMDDFAANFCASGLDGGGCATLARVDRFHVVDARGAPPAALTQEDFSCGSRFLSP
jgi:hypothetical protein